MESRLDHAPRDIVELRALILSRKLVFPPQLQRIVEVGLVRPDVIAFGTSASIARECGVATTTVQRLPRFLGMRSVKQVKGLFQSHLAMLRSLNSGIMLSIASTVNDANGAL